MGKPAAGRTNGDCCGCANRKLVARYGQGRFLVLNHQARGTAGCAAGKLTIRVISGAVPHLQVPRPCIALQDRLVRGQVPFLGAGSAGDRVILRPLERTLVIPGARLVGAELKHLGRVCVLALHPELDRLDVPGGVQPRKPDVSVIAARSALADLQGRCGGVERGIAPPGAGRGDDRCGWHCVTPF